MAVVMGVDADDLLGGRELPYGIALPISQPWDFPLSREEVKYRVWHLMQCEIGACGGRMRKLERREDRTYQRLRSASHKASILLRHNMGLRRRLARTRGVVAGLRRKNLELEVKNEQLLGLLDNEDDAFGKCLDALTALGRMRKSAAGKVTRQRGSAKGARPSQAGDKIGAERREKNTYSMNESDSEDDDDEDEDAYECEDEPLAPRPSSKAGMSTLGALKKLPLGGAQTFSIFTPRVGADTPRTLAAETPRTLAADTPRCERAACEAAPRVEHAETADSFSASMSLDSGAIRGLMSLSSEEQRVVMFLVSQNPGSNPSATTWAKVKMIHERPAQARLEYLRAHLDDQCLDALRQLPMAMQEQVAMKIGDSSRYRNLSAFVWAEVKALNPSRFSNSEAAEVLPDLVQEAAGYGYVLDNRALCAMSQLAPDCRSWVLSQINPKTCRNPSAFVCSKIRDLQVGSNVGRQGGG